MVNAFQMQIVGFNGLIDDWWNGGRNKIKINEAGTKIAVVTGGARGIGKEIVKALLEAKLTVVVGVRKVEAAEKLAKELKNGENLHAYPLDLQSLNSVGTFSKTVLQKYPSINLLICNAGVMFCDYKLTEDGFENQLGTNYLGHFYLTHWLLPALKKAGTAECLSRVVNVSSCAHNPGKIHFDDINMKKKYNTYEAYSQSKLAQVLSAKYINKLMIEEGCFVRCYSAHPGVVNTDLLNGTWVKSLFPWMMNCIFKSPEEGSVSILFACFDEKIEGGSYISNCHARKSNSFSVKLENMIRLHNFSCEMVKIDPKSFGQGTE